MLSFVRSIFKRCIFCTKLGAVFLDSTIVTNNNMPSEKVFGFDSIENLVEKSVQKIRRVIYCKYLLPDDVKILEDVIDYQKRIQKRVKLVLENPEFENIDQNDLTSTPWERLGSGYFGTVYKAKLKGASVAVKVFKVDPESQSNEIVHIQAKNEGRILRLLRHDNVVAYRGMDTLKKDLIDYNVKKGSVMIIMEYIPDNLWKYVEGLKRPELLRQSDTIPTQEQPKDQMPETFPSSTQGLPKNQVWDFGSQIISGLYYLHSCDIAHRDLKPDNVLLEKGVARMHIKLADFGGAFQTAQEDDCNNELHLRWTAPEIWNDGNFDSDDFYMKADIYSYGLVLRYMLTGEKMWSNVDSYAVSAERKEEPHVKFPESLKGPLKDICESCCNDDSNLRPSAENIVTKHYQAHKENPYTVAVRTAEFFTCGFLKETNIVVADSLVDESLGSTSNEGWRPIGYPADCLSCEVEVDDPRHNDCPDDFEYKEKYCKNHNMWRVAALDKVIDDNPNIALKQLRTPREGDDEEQRVELKFAQATYVHHRAMRDVWKGLEGDEKTRILPCKTSVHPVYSTSFGLHVAVLTADEPRMFVFTRRANRGGMASPGTFTCGAVESCSIKDYAQRDGKTYVQLLKTAARGLEEELGVVLTGTDLDALCLTTVYLKFDHHEWGMCGFVDLSDERVAPEHRLTFSSLNSRFTGGPKDKFEHDRLVAIPFKLREMAHFVRENFHDFASSAKLVVVKVLQSFFGVSEVEETFKALDSSDE